MRILVPNSIYQYDVGSSFARDLAKALASLPGQVVEQAAMSSSDDLMQATIAFQPDLIFSIQGLFYDCSLAKNFAHPCWMLMCIDHPSYNYHSQLSQQKNRTLITTFEPSYLACLKQLLPKIPRALLAHPAPSDVPRIREPDLGVCFLGSWTDPDEQMLMWPNLFSNAIMERLSRALEQGMTRHCADAATLLPFSEFIWRGNRDLWLLALCQINTLIRLRLRRQLLQELDRNGVGIDIFGNGWNAAEWKHHRIHTAVTYQEAMHISARSQGILSITPSHTGGSHERVLSCLAQGSVCITSPSSFYVEAGFMPGRDYLVFDPWDPSTLSKAITQLPMCYASQERLAALPHTQDIIERNHSPVARAHRILHLAHEHFGLQ